MDKDKIIDGLKMTMELCVLDPSTGEEIEPHLLNDISRATYDACKGALEILERLDADSDTISRQAAIDAICNACGKIDCDKMDKCEKLQLPPANCSEFPNSSDTISRQQALEALDKRFDSIPMKQTSEILMLRKDLRNLPPAQPKQRTGKWIKLDMHRGMADHKCTACEQECYVPTCMGEPMYAFCPNCGAKMEE